jgi:dienelactone hydrolase
MVFAFSLLLIFSCELTAQDSLCVEDLLVLKGTPLEQEFREMLFNHQLRLADEATERRLARLGSLRSQTDFVNWQEETRKRFLDLIGGLPRTKTPLNPRVVGQIERDGYIVRQVIFESLPEFYVTANLYVPSSGRGPYPAILAPCGHSRNGKAYDAYQRLFIFLAKLGFVVLTYDAPGQGERLQYWDFVFRHRQLVDKSNEHGMMGIPQYLLGQNLARYLIWDGIRALDYLTSLPEVDSSRVGATGNSGGGTLTTYISMLDPCVKVASIVTYITSIPKKIEARIDDAEADPEQDVVGLLAKGIDHTEMLGAIAPRPVLIGAALRDFFPIDGTRKTFLELQQVYQNIGYSDRIDMVTFDHEHEYSQPLRESTIVWFERWLKGTTVQIHETQLATEADRTLECTPTGQVVTSLGGKRVPDFNRAEAARLVTKLEDQRQDATFRQELLVKIRKRLSLPSVPLDPHPRVVGQAEINGLMVEKLLLESEPGIVVPVRIVYSKSRSVRRAGVIYLRDRTGGQDSPKVFEDLARQGRIIAVVDVRGFGETRSL